MPDQEIAVVPYDPEWPLRFDAERRLLEQVLSPWLERGVHHIGSTAVPGLAAKPILDMMAGVRDFEEARAAHEPLGEYGYVHEPHRPGIAHHFVQRYPSRVKNNLHLTEPESDLWRERLAFRDALRADPQLADEYEALKLRLARDHANDGAAYSRACGRSSPACSLASGFSPAAGDSPRGGRCTGGRHETQQQLRGEVR